MTSMHSFIVQPATRRRAFGVALGAALLTGCGSDGPVTPNAALDLGGTVERIGAQTVSLEGGTTGADYVAVLVNTNPTAGVRESFSLRGTGLVATANAIASASAPTLMLSPAGMAEGASAPVRDRAFEARLRASERSALTPRIASARAWMTARTIAPAAGGAAYSLSPTGLARRDAALPANVAVGDLVTVNVNGNDACANPVYHAARVAAIGTHAIILADTLNPAGGFTAADYQRYAAHFDTLVFPLDSAAFGPPTDIDANGHIGLIFTRAVNELTPRNASSFVGGFTFSRDLFPLTSTARAEGCPASNEGEYFYLMAADPRGVVNGNVRTVGFVDSNTTAVIAHELQHLINAGRRLYVNNAMSFEETWLDEGLAHSAEELLFYREAGLTPKLDLDTPQIRASTQRRTAFNFDMTGNAGRYRTYLLAPSTSSPYAADDSLSTRGAAWSLLRYLGDRSSSPNFLFRLVNSTATGLANLQAVYGADLTAALKDWSVSHAVDDVAATVAELQQPSWNWHSVYATLYGTYPLATRQLSDGVATPGSVTAGGAAFFTFGVPAGGTASVTVDDASTTASSNLRIVVVRVR